MNTIDDIINFIDSWRVNNGILNTVENITEFIEKLQEQIAEMDFSVPDGTTMILYTGESNGTKAWEIVERTSDLLGESIKYISDLPAGELINNDRFEEAMNALFKDNQNVIDKIIHGKDNGARLAGGSSGYGDYLSLDDFISKKIASGSTNASNNLIIFCPEEVDMTKVLSATELPEILNNSTFEFINGIPKSIFQDLYESGNIGTIYQLLSRISREVVGDTRGLAEQVSLFQRAIGENGILSSTSNEFSVSLYFDELTGQLTAQLFSNSKGIPLFSDYTSGNCLLGGTEIGTRYTKLAEGGRVFEITPSGERICLGRADIVTAEEAVTNGYKAVKGCRGIFSNITKEGFIKLLCVSGEAIGTVLIVEGAVKEFSAAWDEYLHGNYRTGSKELITYSTSLLGSLAGSSLLPVFAAGIGMAVGGPIGIAAVIVGCIIGSVIGEWFGDAIGDFICDLLGYEDANYSSAGIAVRYDPLVIDLDGDGFELLSVKDGVYFDEDASGLMEKTAWVSSHDALLAIDLNGDGIINDGSELFGTSTKLANGTNARSGFEALAQYDLNGDGVIDENDEVFGRLKVWQDKNGDGISQEDELYSLEDLGIESISLNTSEEDGRLTAKINYKDGSESKIGEFDFDSELYNTKEKDTVEISDEILGLPNIQAMGRVASLHTLMQLDETGILKGYVEQFAASLSRAEKEELLTKILYFITGADQVAAGSRGSYFDAQKLAVIEQFMGRDFVGTRGANPVNTAAPILENIYEDIYNAYYSMLNAQTHLANYMDLLFWTEDENGNKYINTDIFNAFISLCAEEGNDMTEVVAEIGRYILSINVSNESNFFDYLLSYTDRIDYAKAIAEVCDSSTYLGTDENDSYSGTAFRDILFGGGGSDTLKGNDGNDVLYGEEGDDNLYGEDGEDILIGGTGNDYLAGGKGNDTYIFNLGDGKDIISESEYSQTEGKEDRIVFGEGISAEDIRMRREGSDLIIEYGDGDSVTVQSAYYYADGRACVEYIEFADGTRLTQEDIQAAVNVRYGTDGADTITGYGSSYYYSADEEFHAGAGDDTVKAGDGNDTIYGEEGDDKLYGQNGDDILIGGTGNDYLDGGYGNDTYIFNLGDGNDTIYDYEYSQTEGKEDRIVFGEGISVEDIRMRREGNNLIIEYGDGDSVTVQNAYYYADGRACVEYIEFADGSRLTQEDIQAAVNVRYGTDGADTITGYGSSYYYSADEEFHAGAGDDTVRAGDGNDTVYGEEGDDKLYGQNGDDILIGGTGNDYLDGGYGNDTYIFNLGDGADTIYDYEYSQTEGKEDRIVFGEGINAESITLRREGSNLIIEYGDGDSVTVQNAYYYADGRACVEYIEFADGTRLTQEDIQAAVNVRYGTDGADTITGYDSSYYYSADEEFHAGAGDDTVKGGKGNDTIYGEDGNDSLYGEDGEDILIGGTGNDYLAGGKGNDTYIFNLGDGKDTISESEYSQTEGKEDRIVFGEGINAESITLRREGSNLIIEYGDGDSVTVQNAYYYADGRACVEYIEFADGTRLTQEDIQAAVNVRYGTDGADTITGYDSSYYYSADEEFHAGAGDDTVKGGKGNDTIYGEEGDDNLYGEDGEDVLIGGTGNDYLYGGYGNDTYIFNLGDGADIISEYENSRTEGKEDRIVFGEGISVEDIRMRREGSNLIIEYGDGDSVTVQSAYYYADGRACVEYIEFADGSKGTIDYENVKLDIMSAENENDEDSALLEPTTDVAEVEEVNVFDEYMGDNNEMSNELPEETDTTVDNCVEALEELYMSEQTSDETNNDDTYYEEQENAIYDNSTDSMVDSIVNQLVQDMSENEVNTVSDSDVITGASSSDDNVQLWAS